MLKIIIPNNNDILYDSLSNIVFENEEKIELINVPLNQLSSLVYKMSKKENLIILDISTSISFCINILKNLSNRLDKGNIIILVVDSKQLTNIVNHERINLFFRQKNNIFSAIEAIRLISNSVKNANIIEKKIDSMLWELGFTSYFKATNYLKDAILLAYTNEELLQDTYLLIKKVARKNNIKNEKSIRSIIDKSINSILDYTKIDIVYRVFGDCYDGRKISFKYFIDLFIRYLNKKDIAV